MTTFLAKNRSCGAWHGHHSHAAEWSPCRSALLPHAQGSRRNHDIIGAVSYPHRIRSVPFELSSPPHVPKPSVQHLRRHAYVWRQNDPQQSRVARRCAGSRGRRGLRFLPPERNKRRAQRHQARSLSEAGITHAHAGGGARDGSSLAVVHFSPCAQTPAAARSSTGTTSLAQDLIRAILSSFGGYTATRSVGQPFTARPWPLKPLPTLGPVKVVTTTRWTCSTAAIARRAGPLAYVPIGPSRCCLPLSCSLTSADENFSFLSRVACSFAESHSTLRLRRSCWT